MLPLCASTGGTILSKGKENSFGPGQSEHP
jgi:hypothetical protein